ncbi:Sensor protein CitS [Anoxybacillus sp. BCO1]|nr:Sensor protein CitS [Anoxybacillus sp. BCO1]
MIIEVEDTGAGIPDGLEFQIFNKGFSTKSGMNRGYGLDLVQKSLTALQGHITYHTEQGKGTVFTVVIPKRRR